MELAANDRVVSANSDIVTPVVASITGASLVPVMVTVTSWVTVSPFWSSIVMV